MRSVLLLGITAVLPAFASAQKVVLKLNPPPGAKYGYAIKTVSAQHLAGADMSLSITFNGNMNVLSNSGGKVKLASSMSNVNVKAPKGSSMAGIAQQIKKNMEGASYIATLTSSGAFLGIQPGKGSTQMNPAMANLGDMMVPTTMPKAPVGIGSTWKSTFDISKMRSAMPGLKINASTIPITFRLVGFGVRNGKKTVKINFVLSGRAPLSMAKPSATAPVGSMTMNIRGGGSTELDLGTGMWLKSSSVIDVQMVFSGNAVTSRQTTTMTLK